MRAAGEIDGCAQPRRRHPRTFHDVDHSHSLFVHDTVVQFSKFGIVPTVGRTHEIARYSLKTVDGMAAAFGAHQGWRSHPLVTAVHGQRLRLWFTEQYQCCRSIRSTIAEMASGLCVASPSISKKICPPP